MDFKMLLSLIKEELNTVVFEVGDEYRGVLETVAEQFLKRNQEDISRYFQLLAGGSLSLNELQWLLLQKKELMEIQALGKVANARTSVANIVTLIIGAMTRAIVRSVMR